MLTGTLIGKAARTDEESAALPFVEFFRNVAMISARLSPMPRGPRTAKMKGQPNLAL